MRFEVTYVFLFPGGPGTRRMRATFAFSAGTLMLTIGVANAQHHRAAPDPAAPTRRNNGYYCTQWFGHLHAAPI